MRKLKEIEKLLICVDMVNGFVKEGPMSDTYIEHIVPENIKLMKKIIEDGERLAIIKDTHKEDAIEFKRYPKHCIEGTREADLIDELKSFEKDSLVYKKNSTSTIYAPGFLEDIDKMDNLKEVIITGCCTDICVINLAIPLKNYFDEHDRDVNIVVPKNAVETYNSTEHNREEYNEMAFKLMKQAGIELV